MPLKPWIDGEATGRWVHASDVLTVVDVLQDQLVAIVPRFVYKKCYELFSKLFLSKLLFFKQSSGQSYKGSMIVNYNSRVVPALKKTLITTLES